MSLPFRFQTTYRLCQDILNGCVEGTVKLEGQQGSYELLQDTLACLASEEIKLASLKARQDGEDADGSGIPDMNNPQDIESAVVAAAKKTIISQVCLPIAIPFLPSLFTYMY